MYMLLLARDRPGSALITWHLLWYTSSVITVAVSPHKSPLKLDSLPKRLVESKLGSQFVKAAFENDALVGKELLLRSFWLMENF
jgi:hypothetical protein